MKYWEDYEWIHHHDSDEDAVGRGCLGAVIYAVSFILILLFCALLSGCTNTKYITVPVSHTDTLIITKQQRDSIYLKDSTHVSEQQRGDTIILKITKFLTKYHDREVHDTLYKSRTDTVPVPYPVPEYVEKQLSWWQKTRLRMGEILLGLMVLIAIIGLIKLKTKIWP